ncbi:MAG: hypothetical protein R3C39_04160 [Dehalococcoidia bacterium]
MILTKGLARLGLAFGVVAVALGVSALFAAPTHAQNPPATFYGTAAAGDTIEATIDGTVCATATADATGFWMLTVDEGGACAASDGDTVGFTLNGAAAAETETWKAGGAPADVANGVTLTASGVTPPSTGNAGLLPQGTSTSPWIALMLGAFALAGLAGARAMTGRRA